MIHFTGVEVVSTAAVSVRLMSNHPSRILAPFTIAVSLSRSMPFDASHNSSKVPLMRTSLMKPLVLILACSNDNSLMIIWCLNKGLRRTSTTIFPISAIVSVTCGRESFGCKARKPSKPRFRGNSRQTCSTVISIPVFSEAMAATFLTAQFCTGGK